MLICLILRAVATPNDRFPGGCLCPRLAVWLVSVRRGMPRPFAPLCSCSRSPPGASTPRTCKGPPRQRGLTVADCIRAGANGTLESSASGDDDVSGTRSEPARTASASRPSREEATTSSKSRSGQGGPNQASAQRPPRNLRRRHRSRRRRRRGDSGGTGRPLMVAIKTGPNNASNVDRTALPTSRPPSSALARTTPSRHRSIPPTLDVRARQPSL